MSNEQKPFRQLRHIMKSPLRALLAVKPIRERIAFEIKYRYFESLDLRVPVGEDFCCPVRNLDSLDAFREIFVGNEYGNFLDLIPPPRRWLDIGCHLGYFS